MPELSNRKSTFLLMHLHEIRRTVQILTILLIISVPILNKYGYSGIVGTFYSISLGGLNIVDPALAVQSILLTKSFYMPLFIGAVIPTILALLFGKIFCSWMCPFHYISEIFEKLRKRIRKMELMINHNPNKWNYWIGFGIILLLLIVTEIPIITFLSMPGLITAQIADGILFKAVGPELLLVLVILLIEISLAPRFWCKYVCPVGVTLSLFHNSRTMMVAYNADGCSDCQIVKDRVCNTACPLNLNPKQINIYPYCNNCLECVNVCQKNGRALNLLINKKYVGN